MVRLTRPQQQARTRAAVLAAAAAEFAEHEYATAKIDRIADRAELTRGAVYSNFPGKRAVYLAVLLAALGESPAAESATAPPADVAAAAESFARIWLERLPLATDSPAEARLRSRSIAGVFDDEPGRAALAEVIRLEALLLALALETCRPHRGVRRVRLAELLLTLLHGADHLAQAAAGFGEPFDVLHACRHLSGLDLADAWEPAHLPFVAPAEACDDDWAAPDGLTDVITGQPVPAAGDGLVVVLGANRLSAAEEAVRAAADGETVTVAVVTGDPAETGALARLRLTDLAACLRRVFTPAGLPALRVVLDEAGAVAAAVGVGTGSDTEAAVRVRGGRVVARSVRRGAAYAVAADRADRS